MDNDKKALEVYDLVAERREHAWRSFDRGFSTENPPPTAPKAWQGLPWIMIPFFIIAAAGVALSSLRTAPVFQRIALNIVGIEFATFEAVLAIIVVDIYIVVSRYMQAVLHGDSGDSENTLKWMKRGFWTAFVIAIFANLYASVGDLPIVLPLKPYIDLVVGLAVGLSAPLLAFISGDILGILWVQSDKKRKSIWREYRRTMAEWNKARSRAWAVQKADYGLKIKVESLPVGGQTGQPRLSDQTADRQTAGQTIPAASGFNRTADGQRKVREFLEANPISPISKDGVWTSRDLAKAMTESGVRIGHDTASKALKPWKQEREARQQIQQRASESE